MTQSFEQKVREEARLIMLRELNTQVNGRLSSSLLQQALEAFGIGRARAWVHEELRELADRGAVELFDMGTVKIADLTDKGRDHVERRIILEGVKRPSFGG